MNIDITPEAVEGLWEDYLEAARPDGGDDTGGIELYDIEGMNDAAHSMFETLRALSAALSALAMRERAAVELDNDVADLKADASRFRSGTDPHHGRMAFAEAAKRQSDRIRALPTTFTNAELIASAMQLPEVRALISNTQQAFVYVRDARPDDYERAILKAESFLEDALAPFTKGGDK